MVVVELKAFVMSRTDENASLVVVASVTCAVVVSEVVISVIEVVVVVS